MSSESILEELINDLVEDDSEEDNDNDEEYDENEKLIDIDFSNNQQTHQLVNWHFVVANFKAIAF